MVLALLLFTMFAAPTHSSDAPVQPSDDTITVPTFIPGFDDVDPATICSPRLVPNRIDFNGCGGSLHLLPWATLPSPPSTDRIRFVAPAT